MIQSTSTRPASRTSHAGGSEHGLNLPNPVLLAALVVLLVLLLLAVLFVVLLGEKGEEPSPPGPAPMTRVLADFSDSALTVNGSDLNAVAFNEVSDLIDTMEVGSAIEVTGFTIRPGQSCDPIWLSLPVQANPVSQQQVREDLQTALPGMWQTYETCLKDETTGHEGGGSGVFGAVALASTQAPPPGYQLHDIVVISDGCSFGELGQDVCLAKVLNDPAGPQRVVDAMPAALKPPIAVPVTFSHLGRGTQLSAENLLTLKSLYTLYGSATGTRVTFLD